MNGAHLLEDPKYLAVFRAILAVRNDYPDGDDAWMQWAEEYMQFHKLERADVYPLLFAAAMRPMSFREQLEAYDFELEDKTFVRRIKCPDCKNHDLLIFLATERGGEVPLDWPVHIAVTNEAWTRFKYVDVLIPDVIALRAAINKMVGGKPHELI